MAVVGPGAVGCTLAASLNRAGLRPQLVGRRAQPPVEWRNGDQIWRGDVVTRMSPAALQGVVGCVIAVKSYDLAAVLKEWPAKLPETATIVVAVNGAVDVALRQHLTPDQQRRVRLTATRFGTAWHEDGFFEWRSPAGRCDLGPLFGIEAISMQPWEHQWQQDELLVWHDDMQGPYRQKWLGNVVINTLTALHDCAANGDLLQHEALVDERIQEGLRLGKALWGPWPLAEAEHQAAVWELIRQTAANENSMRRDRRLGRRLELDLLSGLATRDPAAYPLLAADDRQLRDLAQPEHS